jgi:hypothetical protein
MVSADSASLAGTRSKPVRIKDAQALPSGRRPTELAHGRNACLCKIEPYKALTRPLLIDRAAQLPSSLEHDGTLASLSFKNTILSLLITTGKVLIYAVHRKEDLNLAHVDFDARSVASKPISCKHVSATQLLISLNTL